MRRAAVFVSGLIGMAESETVSVPATIGFDGGPGGPSSPSVFSKLM
jgi:hypothetical protein